jgi:iron complex transport system substrate-binding protein
MRLYLPLSRTFIFSLLVLLFGCREKPSETVADAAKKGTASKITVTDDLGRKLEIPAQPKRVFALASSMTEMLFAVVPDSLIVARTQTCNYPPQAMQKPVVNSYPVDLETLLGLKPDLIFSIDGITSAETAAKIQDLKIPVYYQKYETVQDVFKGLNDIGRIMHCEAAAKKLTDSLQTQLNAIEKAVKSKDRPTVLAITWQDPIYVFGRNTIMTDKIKLAGGENAVQEIFDQPYPPLTREYILKLNPDVIFGLDAERKATFFKLYPELKKVKAYRNNRIYDLTDDLASRPSPRVVESVKEIQKYLQL